MSQAEQLIGRQLGAFVSGMSRKRVAGTLALTCEYGHPACSTRDGGPCLPEVLAVIERRRLEKLSPFAREHAAAGAAQ